MLKSKILAFAHMQPPHFGNDLLDTILSILDNHVSTQSIILMEKTINYIPDLESIVVFFLMRNR